MKYKWLLIAIVVNISFIHSQEDTEIYLLDLVQGDSLIVVNNPINISKNKGYDNQPSFLHDGSGVLFSGMRYGQTDIVLFDIETRTKKWLTDTYTNEYGPQQTYKKKYFSAIKQKEDGSQQLWEFSFNGKRAKKILESDKVAYHLWIHKKMFAAFIIGDPSILQVSNLKFKIQYPIAKNIGRTLQLIPNTNQISLISYEQEDPEIYAVNPINSQIKYLTDPLKDVQDFAWLPDGTMIMGKDSNLYKFVPGKDKKWIKFANLAEYSLKGITRIAASPLGTKLAIVVNEKYED
ncbi:MAG: hypothetical protein CR985_02120 [Flavobacteriales bacterium]|nr:MAG: hypothetical protein CR985_02120 [Flavobacteriales bacterium]